MNPKPYNRKKRFYIELSRSQLFFSVAGALFILCWIFILGVFVGRGYISDTITRTFTDKIQKLQEEKQALIDKYQEKKADIPQEQIVNPSLDFFNKPSQKETVMTRETIPQPTPKPVPPEIKTGTPGKLDGPETKIESKSPPLETKAFKSPMVETKIPKVPPIENKASKTPPAETKVTKAPQGEAKASKTTSENLSEFDGFIVQIGSYREESTAQSSVKRLAEKGHQAHLKMKDIPQKGGKWYRVQIGPFKNRLEAEKALIRLEHDGFRAVVVGKSY